MNEYTALLVSICQHMSVHVKQLQQTSAPSSSLLFMFSKIFFLTHSIQYVPQELMQSFRSLYFFLLISSYNCWVLNILTEFLYGRNMTNPIIIHKNTCSRAKIMGIMRDFYSLQINVKSTLFLNQNWNWN